MLSERMKKGFTIIELLVAMALLGILIAISGLVFATAVKAYRTASASTEIAAKLTVLTDRLDRDFQSLVPGMPIAVWFEEDSSGKRYDQIQFFSAGDNFQSAKQWTYYTDLSVTPPATDTATLSGNTARIYYGHANQMRISGPARTFYRRYDYSSYVNSIEQATETILCRRIHLMTSLPMQSIFPSDTAYASTFFPWVLVSGNPYGNDVFEYDIFSPADWNNILSIMANADQYLTTCFANPTPENPPLDFGGRPGVDLTNSAGQSLHMILSQGVGSFSIQWSYTADDMRLRVQPDSDLNRPSFNEIRWWPSTDPDGIPSTTDSDFGLTGMNAGMFGCYMQFPGVPTLAGWNGMSGCLSQANWRFVSTYFPKALKFTFTLYDSKGVFKDGRTFTHIVYLND